MTFPSDLLIFLPAASRTNECSSTWKQWGAGYRAGDPSPGGVLGDILGYLGEGEAPGELLSQHGHACDPEEEQIAARLQ